MGVGEYMDEDMNFCMIETADREAAIKFPRRLKYIPKKWRVKAETDYIRNELPVTKEIVTYFGVSGMKIILPYTFYQLQDFGIEEIKEIFECIIRREGVQNIVAKERLLPYIQADKVADGNLIPLLFMNEMIEWIRNKHEISEKEQHIVIIDSGGFSSGFVLSHLEDTLNHLTIITKREQYFEEYVEYMYEQTGLLVSVISGEVQTKVEGNIVLDLCEIDRGEYQYYPNNSIVIQFFYNKEKAKKIIEERKDLRYYNKIYLHYDNERVNNKLFQAVLCGSYMHMDSAKLENIYQYVKKQQFYIDDLGVRV